ncbi:MAG: GSCFA domain-containing protein [Thermoflexibacter sp.]|jgi:hypothetical protein|nr:GSCFA domain-containing protein [Thermoflexibacter sp.]
MKFRTELPALTSPMRLTLQSPILFIGSCFAENIGNILKNNKFNVKINPFGTIYNPISIFQLLEYSMLNTPIDDRFYVQREEVWHHYYLHSEISALEKNTLAQQTSSALARVHSFLNPPTSIKPVLIITLGTAFVYHLKNERQIVANCHKMPSELFDKKLLTPEEIVKGFEKLSQILPKNLPIILTISPVRHIKDTIPLNAVSKSILRLACHQIAEAFANVSYFPAFELMIDDLRDYRFYDSDMLHPNNQAIDYIFDYFSTTYLDTSALLFIKKWDKISKSLQHKPFHAHTFAHQQFLINLLAHLEAITEIDVSEEIAHVKAQII